MKKTLLAMVMAGTCMATFAQTTPATPTTPSTPTTAPATLPTTSPATTTSPVIQTPTANTPPTTTTTSPSVNSPANSMNTIAPASTINTAPNSNMSNPASVANSSSWDAGTSPYWGWNSYSIWNSSANSTGTGNNMNVNANVNSNSTSTPSAAITDAGSTTTATGTAGTTDIGLNGSMTSSNAYNAYSGTAVSSLPPNVQMNFSKEYPSTVNSQYSWNQYGDWFNTHYTANGRMTQYFYDQRGNGYSLSLPVIQTYVPEDIIDKALNKYGARLYSISMVNAHDSGATYQLGLLEQGQLRMEYLNESGASVTNVWRTEEAVQADMNSISTNAAMDNSITAESKATQTDNSALSTKENKEVKKTWKENGRKTKVKAGDGKMKIKQKKTDD